MNSIKDLHILSFVFAIFETLFDNLIRLDLHINCYLFILFIIKIQCTYVWLMFNVFLSHWFHGKQMRNSRRQQRTGTIEFWWLIFHCRIPGLVNQICKSLSKTIFNYLLIKDIADITNLCICYLYTSVHFYIILYVDYYELLCFFIIILHYSTLVFLEPKIDFIVENCHF